MTTPLEDYAVVGDMRTLAVISRSGSVDWLCWPRFDSPSIFGRLLHDPATGGEQSSAEPDGNNGRSAGSWTIDPVDGAGTNRQVYVSGTNVVVTRVHTSTGLFEIEDYMTIDDDEQHLVRSITCLRGTVEARSCIDVRPDYGRSEAVVERSDDGITISAASSTLGPGHDAGSVPAHDSNNGPAADTPEPSAAGIELHVSGDQAWEIDGSVVRCTIELREGETVHLALGSTSLTADHCLELHDRTVHYWQDWTRQTDYSGRWREHVERSALVLKLLTHRDSGGIIAAGTTSLPEVRGGERNWDYRYVWVRDAAFTVFALIKLGHIDEANAFSAWLIDRLAACPIANGSSDAASGSPLAPLYDLDGNSDIAESELDHWAGYADSTPVRIGNAASDQLQLDIYGELIDALYLADKHGDGVSLDTWSHIVRLIDWLADHWKEPDDGMWEARSGPQRHTTSLLMAWVAVERAMRMANSRGRPAPLESWRALRDEMHDALLERGYNDDLSAFSQVLDGDTVDASMLLAPLVKFVSPTDPRWLSTLGVIEDRLTHGPLVDRYDATTTDDGLDGEEGSFTICSFWYVEALTRAGRVEEAELYFDRLLSYATPTGIFSEEIGPDGRLLGNFPQAFTHLALISAATCLDEALDRIG